MTVYNLALGLANDPKLMISREHQDDQNNNIFKHLDAWGEIHQGKDSSDCRKH